MLDIDHFKQYNDRYGHVAGDRVLHDVGSRLCAILRGHDVVARYGGEEFVILLPATGAGAALDEAERIRTAISNGPWPDCPVTASLGVATSDPETRSASVLVEQADQALYHSKQSGRDRCTHYAHSDERSVMTSR
jgi:diguanylate cyclase (GGDEF)-like protein